MLIGPFGRKVASRVGGTGSTLGGAVNGCRLGLDRLTAAVHRHAPAVAVHDRR